MRTFIRQPLLLRKCSLQDLHLSVLSAVHTGSGGGEEQGGVVTELLESQNTGKVAVGVTLAAEARPHLHVSWREGEQ